MSRFSLVRNTVGILAAAASLSAMFTFTPGAGGAGYLVGRLPAAATWLAGGGTATAGADGTSSAGAAVVIMLYDNCDSRNAGAGLAANSIAAAAASVENTAEMAAQLGISGSTTAKLQQAGLNAEDMLTLSALVKASGKRAEEVAALRAAGQSWDQIAASLGLKLGSLCAKGPGLVSAASNLAANGQATTADAPSTSSAAQVDAAATGRAASIKTCAGVRADVDAQACARLVAALTKVGGPKATSSAALNTCAQVAANLNAQDCLKITVALNSLKASAPQASAGLDAKIEVQPAKTSAGAAVVGINSSMAGVLNTSAPQTTDVAAGLSADAHGLPVTVTTTVGVQTHAQLPSVLGAGLDLH